MTMDSLERIFDYVKQTFGGENDLKDVRNAQVQHEIKNAAWDIYECFSQALYFTLGSYAYKTEMINLLKSLTHFTVRLGVVPAQVLYDYERGADMLGLLYCQNLCDNNNEETHTRLVLDFLKDLGSMCHVLRRSEGDVDEDSRNFLFYLRCTWNNLFAIMGLSFITPDEILDWVEGTHGLTQA